MSKPVTFKALFVAIPEDVEGAARIMGQIAKPRNVTAVMKKLRDYVLLLEGERPHNNRSREQVVEAVSVVWTQLRHSIDVGDWFDRMFMERNKYRLDPKEEAHTYAASLSACLEGRDPQTAWKPFLPVAHMAGGFRIAMFKTNRAKYFRDMPGRDVQLQQVRELLFDDHSWLRLAVEAAEARMVFARSYGVQIPALTRHFLLTEPKSQECTPNSLN